jgi:hypothetical protein
MGAALATLDRRPIGPAFCSVCSSISRTGGRWRTFAAAAATALLLVLLATFAFGPAGVGSIRDLDPIHANDRAGSRRSRLAQDPERVFLGAHVGRIDRGRLSAAGSRYARGRRDADMAVASVAFFALKASALCLSAMLASPYVTTTT